MIKAHDHSAIVSRSLRDRGPIAAQSDQRLPRIDGPRLLCDRGHQLVPITGSNDLDFRAKFPLKTDVFSPFALNS